MPRKAHRLQTTTTQDTTGLDDLFACHDKPGQKDLTLEEAAERLNLSERSVQRWLTSGRLKGYKVKGTRGHEWRIKFDAATDPTARNSTTGHDATLSSQTQGMSQLAQVYEARIERLESKLESATYRNGFLEAQLAGAESQIKLLPDFEAKAAKALQLELELTELKNKADEADVLKSRVADLENELVTLRQGWMTRFGNWLIGKK